MCEQADKRLQLAGRLKTYTDHTDEGSDKVHLKVQNNDNKFAFDIRTGPMDQRSNVPRSARSGIRSGYGRRKAVED